MRLTQSAADEDKVRATETLAEGERCPAPACLSHVSEDAPPFEVKVSRRCEADGG